MKLTDFKFETEDFNVPDKPVKPRDAAKLMVLDREEQTISHETFADLPKYMNEGDVLVYNDTKVFPARLKGKKEKTDADIEVFLLRELVPENMLWDVLVEPARKIRIGNKLYFGPNLMAEVIDNTTSRGRTIRFLFEGTNEELYQILDNIGEMPLPPYIDRDADEADKEEYQTIFAKERGSVAAPFAAMHFTQELVDELEDIGVEMLPITMHIGWGTFRPCEVEDLTKHRTDSENYLLPEETSAMINEALHDDDRKVVGCGSSAVRTIETSITASGISKPGTGWTDEFIFPPYNFNVTEGIITNFHRPESTMLMMGAAYAGYDFLMEAYEEAQEEDYRFFAFGDSILMI